MRIEAFQRAAGGAKDKEAPGSADEEVARPVSSHEGRGTAGQGAARPLDTAGLGPHYTPWGWRVSSRRAAPAGPAGTA